MKMKIKMMMMMMMMMMIMEHSIGIVQIWLVVYTYPPEKWWSESQTGSSSQLLGFQ